MNSKVTKAISAIMISAMVCGTLVGCGKKVEEVVKKEIVVETINPTKGDLFIESTFMGSVTPKEEVYVIPFVNGEVLDVYANVGDIVTEGDVLAKIDDSAANLQLNSAQAGLQTAEASKDAATGGAVVAQNMQTEASIHTIEENRDVVVTNYNKIVDGIAEIDKQMQDLKDKKSEVKEAYQTAKDAESAANALAKDPSDKEAKKVLKKAGYEVSETNPIEVVVATASATKEATKEAYNAVKTAYDTNYPLLEKQRTELDNSREELVRTYDSLGDNLSLAKGTYELSKGQIADETNAVYDAQIAAAKVGVDSAKYQKDLYSLDAPISGVVESVSIKKNDIATSSSPAFVISNKDSMTVTFYVSEDIQKTLSVSDKVRVDRNGSEFEGTITEIGQMVDMQSGLFVIKAMVKASGDDLLTGTSVKVFVDTYRELNTTIIPYDSIYYDNGNAYVYLNKEGKAVKTDVVVTLFNEEQAAVTGEITPEDEVISSYAAALSDGANIVVKGKSE